MPKMDFAVGPDGPTMESYARLAIASRVAGLVRRVLRSFPFVDISAYGGNIGRGTHISVDAHWFVTYHTGPKKDHDRNISAAYMVFTPWARPDKKMGHFAGRWAVCRSDGYNIKQEHIDQARTFDDMLEFLDYLASDLAQMDNRRVVRSVMEA